MHKSTILVIIIFLFSASLYAQPVNQEEESFYVAKKAYEDGFYEVALNLFQRFFKNFPQSRKIPEANLYIAQCYFQQNKFIDALTQLEKLSSDPTTLDLKDRVLYWIGEVHFRGEDYNKAISFYQRIIEEFPESELLAHAYYSRGWCLFELGENEKAIGAFDKVINIFPDKPITKDAYMKTLECLYKLKDYEKLKKEITVFQKRYPDDTTYSSLINFLLAEYYLHYNKYKEAIQQYQMTLDGLADHNTTFYSHLGLVWCYLEIKNYPEAHNLLNNIRSDNLTDKQREALLLTKANLLTRTESFSDARLAWSELQKIATDYQTRMQAYLGEADMLYNLGKYAESIVIYQGAKEITAKLPSELSDKLYYKLAWAFLKNGQFKEAIDEFQKAASYASDEIIKVTSLCQVGDAYQDAEDYEKAIQFYDKILTDYPNSFYVDYVQYQLGLAFMRLSRYDDAVLAFRVLLHNFPKSKLKAQTVYSLALGLFQKQDYQGTHEALQRYIQDFIDKDLRVDALHLLGTSLYNLGQFSEAMRVFKQIIRESEHKDKEAIQKAEYEIADCLYQMGKEKEALRRFEVLRAKYPDSTLSSEVTWWLGEYYFRRGNLGLSRRYFSTLIRDFPQSNLLADSYYALGLLDQEEGKINSAIDNFKKVMSTGSRDLIAQAGIAIGDILVQLDRLDESEIVYKEAIKKSPAFSGLIYPKISRIYEKRADFDQAIRFYQKALSLVSMKEAATLQFRIARNYENKGDYDQAVEEYLKIPYLYPTDSQLVVKAYLNGAQIYENQKDFHKAKEIYLKVASMNVEEAKYAKERLKWIEGHQK